MSQEKRLSVQEQAEQQIRAEALQLAKSAQVSGQTKEQTKLIAKGIEKGIALYKQQQSAKARERDKARKKAAKLTLADSNQSQLENNPAEIEFIPARARNALWFAGGFFALVALVHLLRYVFGWALLVENFTVPLTWSVAGFLIALGLAVWMFQAGRD
jgi:hypothetical protein